MRFKGPAVETIKLEAEIDAADQLEFPDQNRVTVENGIQPQLAVLESLVHPTSAQLLAVDRQASSGTLEIAPMEAPLTLFVWSKNRIVPVRLTEFSITEEAFDPALNPIRAKVSLGLRVLSVDDLGFAHKGGSLFMSYLQAKEQLAAKAQLGAFRGTRHRRNRLMDPVQAFMQANALATPLFPPDQPLPRHRQRADHGDGRHGDRLSKRRFVPPPESFALLQEHMVVSRAIASTTWPRAISATRAVLAHLRRQRRHAAGRADRNRRAAGCASRCRKGSRERPMLAKGIQLTLLIGPVVPCRRRAWSWMRSTASR